MIRKILTKLNYKELSSNKYYYEFQYNQKIYFVFREDSLKLFSLERFKVIEPKELITEFWIQDPTDEIKDIKSSTNLFNELEDFPLSFVIGYYMRLINLSKAKTINDDIDDYIIDQLVSLEVLGKAFFISKEGLSIMTKREEKSNIPEGIILFSKFNVKNYGYPNLFIPKAGGNRDQDSLNIITHLIFNPVTLIDIYNKTYNHYNSNFYISSDIHKTDLKEINNNISNIKVHIRPTSFELLSYLYFIEKLYSANNIEFKVNKSTDNKIKIRLHVTNYATIRNDYINRLNNLFDEDSSIFRAVLLKKNIKTGQQKLDYIEFSFINFPIYILSFIRVFMLEYYNNIYNLTDFTHLYYEDEFALSLSEEIPTPEELFNMATKNENIFEDFDDTFDNF